LQGGGTNRGEIVVVNHTRWGTVDFPTRHQVYNPQLSKLIQRSTMDAEQLNAIANRLADLSARTTDLRRYL